MSVNDLLGSLYTRQDDHLGGWRRETELKARSNLEFEAEEEKKKFNIK
jgi:hypothetical protein